MKTVGAELRKRMRIISFGNKLNHIKQAVHKYFLALLNIIYEENGNLSFYLRELRLSFSQSFVIPIALNDIG
jgi:hypothetical protein